jgi:hypothetical protein
MEKLNIQTQYLVQVIRAFMAAAIPVNIMYCGLMFDLEEDEEENQQ